MHLGFLDIKNDDSEELHRALMVTPVLTDQSLFLISVISPILIYISED